MHCERAFGEGERVCGAAGVEKEPRAVATIAVRERVRGAKGFLTDRDGPLEQRLGVFRGAYPVQETRKIIEDPWP